MTSKPLPTKLTLTIPQRDLLWRVAQHKYGWTGITPRERPTADALVRRGLVAYGVWHGRCDPDPVIVAVQPGCEEIARRWPVSPCAMSTYDHQPNGWTPKEGVPA